MKVEDFKPLSDRVLIELQYTDRTAGGIYIPEMARDRGTFAKVIKCGPGKTSYHTHKLMPMDVKEGDQVLIGKYTGWTFDNDNPNLKMIHNSDILAIL